MSIRQPETKDPYYAQGRTVFPRPQGGQMGFKLCTVDEFVESGPGEPTPAEYIAQALNALDATLAQAEVVLLDDSVSQDRVTLMAEVSELEGVEP